jgi:D-lactate dehydrogenase (cytochrome)
MTNRPRAAALIECPDDAQAVAVTGALRHEAHAAWAGRGLLDVAAIEYIDARALSCLPPEARQRFGVAAGAESGAVLIVQIELTDGTEEQGLERLARVLESYGLADAVRAALPGDQRGIQQLMSLREAVPSAVNARVAAVKTAYPEVQKTAGDMIVPFERLLDSIGIYRDAFERRGLEYAIWGHLSDGNLHPNVLPRHPADIDEGRGALLEIARAVMSMGGAPLAEHGVGRNPIKQRLLREMYGESGIEQMRAVKRALDPEWKLAPGVLFPP